MALNGWEWCLPSACRPPPNGPGIGPGPVLREAFFSPSASDACIAWFGSTQASQRSSTERFVRSTISMPGAQADGKHHSQIMVRVAPGSRPPSWSQNEIKVLVDAESSLYSSSIETLGPARPWRENVTRPRSSAGLPRLYPFWIILGSFFFFLSLFFRCQSFI